MTNRLIALNEMIALIRLELIAGEQELALQLAAVEVDTVHVYRLALKLQTHKLLVKATVSECLGSEPELIRLFDELFFDANINETLRSSLIEPSTNRFRT